MTTSAVRIKSGQVSFCTPRRAAAVPLSLPFLSFPCASWHIHRHLKAARMAAHLKPSFHVRALVRLPWPLIIILHISDKLQKEHAGLLGSTPSTASDWMTPPSRRFSHRSSVYSFGGDSKYPLAAGLGGDARSSAFMPTRGPSGAFLTMSEVYDPAESNFGRDPDDPLHEPDPAGKTERSAINLRGCGNVLTMLVVLFLLLGVFMVYPITDWVVRAYCLGLILFSIGPDCPTFAAVRWRVASSHQVRTHCRVCAQSSHTLDLVATMSW